MPRLNSRLVQSRIEPRRLQMAKIAKDSRQRELHLPSRGQTAEQAGSSQSKLGGCEKAPPVQLRQSEQPSLGFEFEITISLHFHQPPSSRPLITSLLFVPFRGQKHIDTHIPSWLPRSEFLVSFAVARSTRASSNTQRRATQHTAHGTRRQR